MADYGLGMSSSGVPFRNEIEAWNDPLRWQQSAFNSAIDRGELAKAKAINDNIIALKGGQGIGMQTNAAEKVASINAEPNLITANRGSKLVTDPSAMVAPKQPPKASLSAQTPVPGGITEPAIPTPTADASPTAPKLEIGSNSIFEEILSGKARSDWSVGGIGNVLADKQSGSLFTK